MTMSISPASIRATNSAALARRPDRVGGDDRGARLGEQRGDLVGDALDAGAAGDQAVLLVHSGQASGAGIDMAAMMAGEAARRGGARPSRRCNWGIGSGGRKWRHRVSGAKPRRLRNSSDLLAALEVCLELARPASARASGRVGGGSWRSGRSPRSSGRRRPGEALRGVSARDSGRSRPCGGSRSPASREARMTGISSNLAAHHRDVAGVVLDAVFLLEARSHAPRRRRSGRDSDRAGTARSARRR